MDPSIFFYQFLIYWLELCACAFFIPSQKVRNALTLIIPICSAIFFTIQFPVFLPWQRLWLGTISLLFTIKAVILLRRTRPELAKFSKLGLLLFMTVWPGMDPQPFERPLNGKEDDEKRIEEKRAEQKKIAENENGKRFVRGYTCVWLGVATLLASTTLTSNPTLANWLGLISLLLMVHFGYAEILTCGMRILGWNVQPLFNAPLRSSSLKDFWSKRWNLAFVEMDKILFLPFAKKRFSLPVSILFVFIISGLLHEAAISYATGQLWGLPLLYFIIQGVGMLIERKMRIDKAPPLVSRTFAFTWLFVPLPLLFNSPFQIDFIAPLISNVAQLTKMITFTGTLNLALWLAAAGYVFILMAGLQVPFRLHWKEEFQVLSSLNRKISLFSAGTVGVLIVGFGALTFVLHNQLAAGERTAVLLSIVISLFWVARLLVDLLYFHHTDWPKGPEFVIGHTLLTTLFICLSGVYTFIAIFYCSSIFPPTDAPTLSTISTLSPKPIPAFLIEQILWIAAAGNFCSLATEIMLASRSQLRADLSKLSNFNRKVMLNYVAYVYTIIFAFGCLTLALHNELLFGEYAAKCISLLMAIFWLLRVLFDCFWLKRSDFADPAEASTSRIVSALFAAILSAIYFYIAL